MRTPRSRLASTLLLLLAPLGLACVEIRVDDDAAATGNDGSSSSAATNDGDLSSGDGDPDSGDGDPSSGDGDPSSGETLAGLVPGPVLADDGAAVVSLAPAPAGDRLLASFTGKHVVAFELADGSPSVVHTIGDGDLFEAGAAVWGAQGAVVGSFNACLVFASDLALKHTVASRCAHLALASDGATLVHTTSTGLATVDMSSGGLMADVEIGAPAGLAVVDATAYVLASDPSSYTIVPVSLASLSPGPSLAIDARGLFGAGPIPATTRYAEAQLWPQLPGSPVTLATAGLEDQKRIAVSPDGRWAASLGFSEGVHVYDASTGAKLASAELEVGNADGLAFDASGERLFAGSTAGVQVFTLVYE